MAIFDGKRKNDNAVNLPKFSKKARHHADQRKKDTDTWESNRLLTSGVAQRTAQASNALDEDEEETRVHLLVHDLRPPFLDGKTIFTKQLEPVPAVRDPQSDMAVFARKGSKILKERKQEQERKKQAQDRTNVAGTALGNLLGVKDDDDVDTAAPVLGDTEEDTVHLKKHQGQSEFSRGKTLKEQREYLPAFAVREDLMSTMRDNQVIIVVGETGSGKTTQLTQYLYEEGYGKSGLIGCTQPRRVAAVNVARRVAAEMEVKLGSTVGYAIRFEDCTSQETKIKYMTEGVLLRESLADPDLDKYSCIIMDEAHERVLNTDILLGLFKKLLSRRRDLKLIVTSATMNSSKFSRFFGHAPEFFIPGRTFPVDMQYSRSPCEDYVDSAVKQVLAIHVSQGPGHILVFMTGADDVETTCELIAERLKLLNDPPPIWIRPLYSAQPQEQQDKAFEPPPQGARKVVVATNIAETSVTIDGIMYVVDSGFSKLKVYNPKMGIDTLQVTPISQANAMQRAGRAGRTGPGKSFHLYTERAFREELYIQNIPEIQRTDLANTVLMLKSLNIKNLLDFDFMDPPPQDAITTSLFDLWALGALNNIGDLTPIGRAMTAFPLEPHLAKMLITSIEDEYQCSEEILTIVSMLSGDTTIFYQPKERKEEADSQREKFQVPDGDHLTFLNVYNQWSRNNYGDAYCARHFLNPKTLRKAKEVREQLADILAAQKMPMVSCGTDWDTVRRCICAAYFHQAAKVKGIGEYANLRTSIAMHLHPTSALFGLGSLPEYVVYHKMLLTTRELMLCATRVDPHWLADLGGVFYSVKEKGYVKGQQKGREVEHSRKAEIEREMEADRLRERRRMEAEGEEEEEQRQRGPGGPKKGNGVAKGFVQSGEVRKPVKKRTGMGRAF